METVLKIRNILFTAFVINWCAVLFVWLLSLTGLYNWLMGIFFNFSVYQTKTYMAYIIGFWKVLAAMFFLIPAVSIHIIYKRK